MRRNILSPRKKFRPDSGDVAVSSFGDDSDNRDALIR
jgi:hypothetical protein